MRGKRRLRTIKLLVVGDAAVGKTTLVMTLRGHNTKDLKSIATDGIDMGDIMINDVNFTCYDFAGQVLVLFSTTLSLFLCFFLYL